VLLLCKDGIVGLKTVLFQKSGITVQVSVSSYPIGLDFSMSSISDVPDGLDI
jgi:hypothetical protein